MNELRIDPRWKWAAFDKFSGWFFYENMPEPSSETCGWNGPGDCEPLAVFSLNRHIDWRDSLHEIVHEDGRSFLRKRVDVPGDGEPVMVLDNIGWQPRYSAGKIVNGDLLCYHSGATKWSSGGMTTQWEKWRRPTAEELEG